jgi:hypothetical protein
VQRDLDHPPIVVAKFGAHPRHDRVVTLHSSDQHIAWALRRRRRAHAHGQPDEQQRQRAASQLERAG